ncbi:discoidin domain-containing protein, partial [Ralstonia pseudosolanacearum]|uniref:discoidin domain-containing protein n=1 Tax=Ralstonia pseudosolanacearum TaxID=1310165 RepID=UPI0026775F1C
GDLYQIVDPLGHTTTINQYDASGRPLQTTDANGTVTAFTYSNRGWLTSQTITPVSGTGQTTNYSYDAVGLLTKVTLPDGSSVSFSYDGAHRLTGAADSQGNSISYTLDAMGNRIQEQAKDPSGSLTRQVDRVFDTINRPLQVTQQGAVPSSPVSVPEALIKVAPVSVAASSTYNDNVPERTLDGVPSNAWIATSYAPQWIEVDLGVAVPLKKLRMLVSQSPAGQTTHVVTGGMSPAPTSVLKTLSGNTSDGQWLEVSLDTAVSVRYIRITTTGSPSWVSWHELEFYRTPTTPATASTLTKITPAAASASGYYSSNVPSQAIDGKNDTPWTATAAPQWIEVDLGAAVPLKKVRMLVSQSPAGQTTHVVTGGMSPAPTSVLQTLSGNTSDGQWLEASLDGSVSVRYIRITTTGSPSWVSWHELEFYR